MPLESSALRLLGRPDRTGFAGGLLLGVLLAASTGLFRLDRGHADEPVSEGRIVVIKGFVEVARAGASAWDPARTNQDLAVGDQLRTGERSRAAVLLRGGSVLELGELATKRFGSAEGRTVVDLLRGVMFFFHRDQPGSLGVRSGGVSAIVRGTEFVCEAGTNGTFRLTLLDGEVRVASSGETLELHSGERVVISPGEAPRRTALLAGQRVESVQWLLYYPAVLDLGDLQLPGEIRTALGESLRDYAAGDLLRALARFPADQVNGNPDAELFHAALQLSVGNVTQAESLLAGLPDDQRLQRLASSLRRLVAASQLRPCVEANPAPGRRYATELMAESYCLQSEAEIPSALAAALAAASLAPDSGFAWARIAELEFSLGRLPTAQEANETALKLSPRHAPAVALRGFLLAARQRTAEAETAFSEAIALDPGLGNAWLGRGLTRLRRGDSTGGRADLTLAAATEPQRALLRSYLGKAFAADRDQLRAAHELDLARRLDRKDPTAWLYSALLHQQGNAINLAVAELERSSELVDNRRIYRSRLLLDEDRAVRSANLAGVYDDAGFTEVAAREATRAVTTDYANAAAHLFLANSYDALRDPRQINLRYETPWFTEFLLANLLAPVGASPLSQTVSQNEYARLLERDGLGVVNDTLWTGNGDWKESASQFGRYGNFAYALDVLYRSEVGQRVNDDLDQLTVSGQFKWQLNPADSVFLQAIGYRSDAGDVAQLYDPAEANAGLRVKETQEPIILAGWHHEWQPGVHTLLLASGFEDNVELADPGNQVLRYSRDPAGEIHKPDWIPSPLDYRSEFTGGGVEAQQIWRAGPQTLVIGGRYQAATFETAATLDTRHFLLFTNGVHLTRMYAVNPGLERLSGYAYDYWQPFSWTLLTAGIVYDRLTQPENFRLAPLVETETTQDQVSPKVGVTLNPWTGGVVRGAFTRSLGGVSFDQSLRLEPVQVAGFNQSFRGLIPEALEGSIAGQEFETWGVAWDQTFPTQTYLTISADQLSSDASQTIGAFEFQPNRRFAEGSTYQDLHFVERGLMASLSQLTGDCFALTARYHLAEATLDTTLPEVLPPGFRSQESSTLHQLQFEARFNHPCGAFATATATWNQQSNVSTEKNRPGDDFWQFDVWAGFRLLRRRAEISAGVLNLTGQDYQLYPLNLYPETYRDRTFALRARFAF